MCGIMDRRREIVAVRIYYDSEGREHHTVTMISHNIPPTKAQAQREWRPTGFNKDMGDTRLVRMTAGPG